MTKTLSNTIVVHIDENGFFEGCDHPETINLIMLEGTFPEAPASMDEEDLEILRHYGYQWMIDRAFENMGGRP